MKLIVKVSNIKWDLNQYDDNGCQLQPSDLGLPIEYELTKEIKHNDEINEFEIENEIEAILIHQYEWPLIDFDTDIEIYD